MSINSIDSSAIYSATGTKAEKSGSTKTSDDYSLYLNEDDTSDSVDSFEKTSDTDKTEAEKELEAKQKEEEEKKKIHEEIMKLQKKLNDINSRIMNMEDGDEKDSLKSQASEIESQISELKAKLNGGQSADSAQDQTSASTPSSSAAAMPAVSMPQSSGGSYAPASSGGGSSAGGLSNALGSLAQMGSGLLSNLGSSAGGANSGGGMGSLGGRSAGNAGSSGGSKASGISNPFASKSNNTKKSNSAAETPGAMNSVMSKAKDSNQSWGDYWKEAGYNEKVGSEFAKKASKTGGVRGTTGKCATGVSESYNAYFGVSMHGDGKDWDENMRTQSNFKEISTAGLSKSELKDMLQNLPAGAVVCWESQDQNGDGRLSKSGHGKGGAGEYYGHVTVADGNGGEYSDHYSSHLYTSRLDYNDFSNDKCAIFIPIA